MSTYDHIATDREMLHVKHLTKNNHYLTKSTTTLPKFRGLLEKTFCIKESLIYRSIISKVKHQCPD